MDEEKTMHAATQKKEKVILPEPQGKYSIKLFSGWLDFLNTYPKLYLSWSLPRNMRLGFLVYTCK